MNLYFCLMTAWHFCHTSFTDQTYLALLLFVVQTDLFNLWSTFSGCHSFSFISVQYENQPAEPWHILQYGSPITVNIMSAFKYCQSIIQCRLFKQVWKWMNYESLIILLSPVFWWPLTMVALLSDWIECLNCKVGLAINSDLYV